MKKPISVIVLLLLMSPVFITAQEKIKPAEEVVMETMNVVLERIVAEQDDITADPTAIYGLMDELVVPHFDFLSMSKWVLGKKNWLAASEQQRQQFVDEFQLLLIRTYSKALLEYSAGSPEHVSTDKNANSALVTVKTVVHSSDSKFLPIDYRMHISGEQWKVVDVVVDSVSLVAAYRGSFSSEIKRNGFDALVNKLSERNDVRVK